MNKLNVENTLSKIWELAARWKRAKNRLDHAEWKGTATYAAAKAERSICAQQFKLAQKIHARRELQPVLYSEACSLGLMDGYDNEDLEAL